MQKILGGLLRIYEDAYYKGTPLISDQEYDFLYDTLVGYEKEAEQEHRLFTDYKKRRQL